MKIVIFALAAFLGTVSVFGVVAHWALRGGKPRFKLPSANFGKNGRKVLVAFSSKAGSTADAALAIGRKLADEGAAVEVKSVAAVEDVSGYDAFVLGSAIRAARPTSDYLNFIKTNAVTLNKKPTAIFLLCMTLSHDTPENRKIVEEYFEPVRKLIRPRAEGYFAGKMVYGRLNPLTKLIAQKMVKVPEGDFTNHEQFERWAESVAKVIQ